MDKLLTNIHGINDYYPDHMKNLEYIFTAFNQVSKSYCFKRYDTCILEKTDIYAIKNNNDDIYKELYTFKSEGQNVCLRPESTTSLVRITKNIPNEPNTRLYNIAQYFRFEKKPNKYRKRCFYQWNVDIINCQNTTGEIEIIDMILSLFTQLNILEMIEIKISHRGAINLFLEEIIGLDIKCANISDIYNVIDKISKTSLQQTKLELEKIDILVDKNIDLLLEFIIETNIDVLIEKYATNIHLQQLKIILDTFSKLGYTNIVLDMSIVRGLNYYTGIVFEVFSRNQTIDRAIAGGGRYDSLYTAFQQKPRQCCGFAVGDVVLLELLKQSGKIPICKYNVDYCIIPIDASFYAESMYIAKKIRDEGKTVCVYTNESKYKLRNAYNYASRVNANYSILVTQEYNEKHIINLKNMNLNDNDIKKNMVLTLDDFIELIPTL